MSLFLHFVNFKITAFLTVERLLWNNLDLFEIPMPCCSEFCQLSGKGGLIDMSHDRVESSERKSFADNRYGKRPISENTHLSLWQRQNYSTALEYSSVRLMMGYSSVERSERENILSNFKQKFFSSKKQKKQKKISYQPKCLHRVKSVRLTECWFYFIYTSHYIYFHHCFAFFFVIIISSIVLVFGLTS